MSNERPNYQVLDDHRIAAAINLLVGIALANAPAWARIQPQLRMQVSRNGATVLDVLTNGTKALDNKIASEDVVWNPNPECSRHSLSTIHCLNCGSIWSNHVRLVNSEGDYSQFCTFDE